MLAICWVCSFILFFGFHYSSNFGPKLIMCSKEKVVTIKEVQLAAYCSHPIMETIVITLMHIAFHSEKLESEVFYNAIVMNYNSFVFFLFLFFEMSIHGKCRRFLWYVPFLQVVVVKGISCYLLPLHILVLVISFFYDFSLWSGNW